MSSGLVGAEEAHAACVRLDLHPLDPPLPTEYGTSKIVEARFWHSRSGKSRHSNKKHDPRITHMHGMSQAIRLSAPSS